MRAFADKPTIICEDPSFSHEASSKIRSAAPEPTTIPGRSLWFTGRYRYPAANAGLVQCTETDGAGFWILDYARRP